MPEYIPQDRIQNWRDRLDYIARVLEEEDLMGYLSDEQSQGFESLKRVMDNMEAGSSGRSGLVCSEWEAEIGDWESLMYRVRSAAETSEQ